MAIATVLLARGAAAGAISDRTTAKAPQASRSPESATAKPQIQAQPRANTAARFHLLLIVRDENGNPIDQARVTVYPGGAAAPLRGVTDTAGRLSISNLGAGTLRVVVEKEGFYALTISEVHAEEGQPIEVRLNHMQEFKESVEVKASTEGIDPAQMAQKQTLNATEILELPYTTTRDLRNALPLLPGVLPDLRGQIHVNGSASNQTLYVLDGFDISEPATGLLQLRVSTDAARSIDVEGSRTSVQYGRGSAGVLALDTAMGDDRFRFYATDFIPSVQQYHGLQFQNSTPRLAFSGPIKKGKAWFYEAVEGEFDENIYNNLPAEANTDYFWRFSNLTRVQVNLTPGNRLTGSVVEDRSHDDYGGLSLTQPLSTTATNLNSAHVANLKDQMSWTNGALLDVGFGFVEFNATSLPLGDQPYTQIPGSALGNFYMSSQTQARRYQVPVNFYLPPVDWHGHHQFQVGMDFERTNYDQMVARAPFTIQTCAAPSTPPGCNATNSNLLVRSVSFQENPNISENDSDVAGYVQDRWSPLGRLLVEPGLRFEHDSVIGKTNVSPRISSTFALTKDGETKLSAGVGLFYDRVDLSLLGLALAGQRQDLFYEPDGVTPIEPPVVTEFQATPAALVRPRSLNWSAGIERKLPFSVYLKTEFIEKRGMDGSDYLNAGGSPGANGVPSDGTFLLENQGQDHFDGVTISARHTFRGTYPVMLSYTWSRARTNTDLAATLDNPLWGPQLAGRLPWDSPNRVMGWGWLPLVRGFTFGYTLDWHTGYPFGVVNQEQELVGVPASMRFPNFVQVDVHVEKQFHFLHYEWAIRGGFNDVTGRDNPLLVDNNIDSPTFLQFTGISHRAFTGRIRFIGRTK
ncbi:MAG TPA: TonB-dependent receptor [Candidatus Limnocylindrales bacterium]|nr:TonB-dependent receptor [Candidatus Limnocylindrales bacterium]